MEFKTSELSKGAIFLLCCFFIGIAKVESNVQGNITLKSSNITSRSSNITSNCTSAHPPVVSNTYYCRPYKSGGHCSQHLGNQLTYGSKRTVTRKEEGLRIFEEGKRIMQIYGLIARESCLAMFYDVSCHWNFPRCDTTSSFLRPQPICRETCELIFSVCDKELEMAIEFNKRRAGMEVPYPYYWVIMNCTTMTRTDGGQTPECYYQEKINSETDKLQSKECYYGNGIGYRGEVNVTRSGRTCQSWSSQCPHRHIRNPENSPELINASNWCRNAGGQGPDGPWCYTTDPSVRWEYCSVPKCPDPAPSRAPTNVKATAHNDTTISVKWTAVPLDFVHGTLKGHRVVFKRKGMPVEQSILFGPNDTEVVISSLVFSTNYSIHIMAVNEFGDGPRSQAVYVVTAPESLTVVRIELTLGNEVFHRDLTNRSSMRYLDLWIRIETDLMALYDDSNSYKIYNIAINGFRNGSVKADIHITAEFFGNQSEMDVANDVKGKLVQSASTGRIGKLSVKSLSVKDAPPPPTNLQSKEVAQNHVLLTWSEPKHKEYYHVTNFTLQFRRSSSEAFTESAVVGPGTSESYIRDLEPGTDYVFRVAANNEYGSGESEELNKRTLKEFSKTVLVISIVLPLAFVTLAVALILYLRIRNKRMKEDIERRELAMEKLAAYLEGNSDHIYSSKDDIFALLNIYANKEWWEIPRDSLEIGDELGSGAFGVVKKGLLYSNKTFKGTVCAVKMLKPQATEKDIRDLCNELNLLAMVGEHQNIVGLIGACSVEGPLWLVVKFAAHGSLLEFLKKFRQPEYENTRDQNKVETLSERDKLKIAFEIASGMAHLSRKKCVHRDLAARNVLLDADNAAMVADFGLSRDVYERGEYETTSGGMLPVRWMAPESLEEYTYTMQSDVWSFGVLMWEVETAGRMPYAGMSGTEIVERISRGYRLPKPEGCTQVMYNIMTDCWQHNPNERPAFKELVERLEKLLFKNAGYLEVVSMETKAQPRKNGYDPIVIKERTMREGTERGDDGQGSRLLLPNEENKHKLGSGMSPQEAQDQPQENSHEATEMKERR